MSPFDERPVRLTTGDRLLAGIYHPGAEGQTLGVVVVVGGPQYRVGSHRQFVHLARHLAANGIPTLRFDSGGMGDSEGEKQPFDALQPDIEAAVDGLLQQNPELRQVVLWGLCDGASAALMYAWQDERVAALVLLNPWLENSQAKARAQLTGYYSQRLLSGEFWRKMVRNPGALLGRVVEFGQALGKSIGPGDSSNAESSPQEQPYQERMLEGWRRFDGPVLLVLSGRDLTAKEFSLQLNSDARWASVLSLKPVSQVVNEEADHTFSDLASKRWVAGQTTDFVLGIEPGSVSGE